MNRERERERERGSSLGKVLSDGALSHHGKVSMGGGGGGKRRGKREGGKGR